MMLYFLKLFEVLFKNLFFFKISSISKMKGSHIISDDQERYYHQLEAQNKAKNTQIKTLWNEMERLTNSRISDRAKTSCSQCETKQNKIKSLQYEINSLKVTHVKEINSLKSTIKYYQSAKTVHQSSSQVDTWKKKCESLQKKINELTTNKVEFIRIDDRPVNNGQTYQIQNDIETLQKRVHILENANNIMKDQILRHNSNNVLKYPTQVIVHPHKIYPQYKTLRCSSPTSCYRRYEHSPSVRNSQNYCTCEYSSPLSVLQRNKNYAKKMNSTFYNRDLFEERRKTLSYKIKVLQNENHRLRQQFCPLHN